MRQQRVAAFLSVPRRCAPLFVHGHPDALAARSIRQAPGGAAATAIFLTLIDSRNVTARRQRDPLCGVRVLVPAPCDIVLTAKTQQRAEKTQQLRFP